MKFQFNVLCLFVQSLLGLSHASVDVKRVLSVNLIKNEINRLHTNTVCALLKVKWGMAAAGGCVNSSCNDVSYFICCFRL